MGCNDCQLCEERIPVDLPHWESRTVDGVFVKQMYLKETGTLVPQHSHKYAHMTMLAHGSVEVIVEGRKIGVFKAPYPIFIEAKKQHSFLSLEPETVLYCIHNTSRRGVVEIHQEAQPCRGPQPQS